MKKRVMALGNVIVSVKKKNLLKKAHQCGVGLHERCVTPVFCPGREQRLESSSRATNNFSGSYNQTVQDFDSLSKTPFCRLLGGEK